MTTDKERIEGIKKTLSRNRADAKHSKLYGTYCAKDDYNADIPYLLTKIEGLEKANKELCRTTNECLTPTIRELKAKLTESQTKIASQEKRIAELKETIDVMSDGSGLKALKVQLDELEELIAEKDSEIKRLGKLADECEPVTRNGEPLATHKETIEKLEAEVEMFHLEDRVRMGIHLPENCIDIEEDLSWQKHKVQKLRTIIKEMKEALESALDLFMWKDTKYPPQVEEEMFFKANSALDRVKEMGV